MFSALLTAAALFVQAAPLAPEASAPRAAPPQSRTVSPLVVTPEVIPSKRRQVDKSELICHDELPPGTRFAIKVCATRGQFEERTQLNRELVREWQRTPITVH